VQASSVYVSAGGHAGDPVGRAGLAHFLEHMLFLGTEDYRDAEAEWERWLGGRGGSSNAWTDYVDSGFHFSVGAGGGELEDCDEEDVEDGEDEVEDTSRASETLADALLRFSSFFVCPLFDPSKASREVNAVHAEYVDALTDDSWRDLQLTKSSVLNGHPYRKFGCGNRNTLADGDGDGGEETAGLIVDLREFFRKNYHAGTMCAAVVGRGSLDELEAMAAASYGRIPLRETPAVAAVPEEPFHPLFLLWNNREYGPAFRSPDNLGIIREVVPLKESRRIRMSFSVPPRRDPRMEAGQPDRVVCHLLGHEGAGSLHEYLTRKGWIEGLSTGGVGAEGPDFSLFGANIVLTEAGTKERDEVIGAVFSYLAILKEAARGPGGEEIMAKYHDELGAMSEIFFRFAENGDPSSLASAAAESLAFYPPSHVLARSSLPTKYDHEATLAFLDLLNPDNMILTVTDSGLQREDDGQTEVTYRTSANGAQWKDERWYRGVHREMRIPAEWAETWRASGGSAEGLVMPGCNPFIPTDFSLRCEDGSEAMEEDRRRDREWPGLFSAPPRLLVESDRLRLWHKVSHRFRVPKASVFVHLHSPVVYASPESMTLFRLFEMLLREDLTSYLYDASMVGYSCRVSVKPSGLEIYVGGYSEKIPELLETLSKRMVSLMTELIAVGAGGGEGGRPPDGGLLKKFRTQREMLMRDTRNFAMDPPYELADYHSRMLLEDRAWHVDQYLEELEVGNLSPGECGAAVESLLAGRLVAEGLVAGNVDAKGAQEIGNVILGTLLAAGSLPLSDEEVPRYRSKRLPTEGEAQDIFGDGCTYPIAVEELAAGPSEENDAIEFVLQAPTQGSEGSAILHLIGHMAYTSAFQQLRTVEQLGYIVYASVRQTSGGGQGLSISVQGSEFSPAIMQERVEAWLVVFREQLERMPEEELAEEAGAVVSILLERDLKLSHEVGRFWGDISESFEKTDKNRMPTFDRLEKLAVELTISGVDTGVKFRRGKKPQTAGELKSKVLSFFDRFLLKGAPERRAIAARVYGQKSKEAYTNNVGKPGILSNYRDVRLLKSYLSSLPLATQS